MATTTENGVAQRTAILSSLQGVSLVKEGETLETGYRVMSITDDSVTLESSDGITDNAAPLKHGPVALTWIAFARLSSVEHDFRNRRRFVHDDDADGVAVIAAQREVGDVHAMLAEDRADLADDARLVAIRTTIIVPSSGASTPMPSTITRRGDVFSNTAPSTQRSPCAVRTLSEMRLV